MTAASFTAGLRSALRQRFRTLALLPRLLHSFWQTSPALSAAIIVLRLLRAAQPPLVLFIGKLIVDEIILQTASPAPGPTLADWVESGRLSAVAGWLLLEFLLVATANALARIGAFVERVLTERHDNALGVALIQQVASLDLRDIEASSAQDRLQRARTQRFMGNQLLTSLLSQAQDFVSLILFVIGLLSYAPLLIVLLLLALLPTLAGEAHFNAKGYGLNVSVTPERRQMDYIQIVGSVAESAKEMKLFGLGAYLAGRFAELADKVHRGNRDLAARRTLWGSLFGAIASLAYYAAYAVIAWRALKGELGIGDLTFLAGSLLRLNGLFERLILGLTQITSQTQYLDDFFSFMDLRSTMVAPSNPRPFPVPMRQGIVFDKVGFRYPGKGAWALRDLSFSIPVGETLALVGENGAGKTTIVKLLTRLYEPDEGRILVDGIDIRDIDIAELQHQVGAIFQDFVRYHMTAAENIGIGRVGCLSDRPRVIEAAQKSLAHPLIETLPEGYEQMLGRVFARGLDLSGGEWQKIAIARAYFRDAAILILDEPTAALDARAEAEIFERFRNLSEAKTALLISHRFATVRMADRILVLENGAILESGSHEELIALHGRYAELFALQAAGFQ
ncbi:ABC transporter ATP-binding protein [Bosea sp. BIWAKO-01]|uniref:ABC transporter ATP-binding protein n=1 Tax=Bosea sp. BIWAKO-01 TaxID=506668 RepID=UPI0008537513|nr:ABC transporter ATP-binding protein [Bosea sp. BIWAKO-01]GAU85154.1 lipid A export ATP-binding/permease protein MsbA [Bosea sp. BIWAKO-01]